MEQAQLSELLMQITRLNKLDIIFLHPSPAHAFPSRLWEGGVLFLIGNYHHRRNPNNSPRKEIEIALMLMSSY